MSDEEIMECVVAGDMEALGTLFDRYKQPLFGFLTRIMKNGTQAEDALLDVFMRLYERRHTYRTGSRFSTWLYTIAHNLAVDRMKHFSQREVGVDWMEEAALRVVDDGLQDEVVRNECAAAVRRAISELPEDQRAVIVMREYRNMSYREIAAIVGLTEEAVRVRAHRARTTLRRVLQPLVEAEA